MIRIDYLGLAAHDPRASAYALASILGTDEPTLHGPPDMIRVELDHGACALFYPSTTVSPQRAAFRLDAQAFAATVARLKERGLAFGNAPEDPRNGRTDCPYGGGGRVCYGDANGHVFEITCS